MSNEKHETVKQSVTDCNHLGNAAKLREALNQIHELLSIVGGTDTAMCIRYEAAYHIAAEAISAPPRNCDLYKTLDDARNAFFVDYVPDETSSSAAAFATWLFDEAKGDEE